MLTSNPNLREMLFAADPCRIVGCYDALSAALVDMVGFDAIWASGLCISATFGVPDANILGFDSFLSITRTITRATRLPVLADCDNGYGDFHNVIHAVQELGRAGVAGICIEDKIFPKLNSFCEQRANCLEHPRQFATKIRAACENRLSDDFVIVARTEALIAGTGIEDALDRAELYHCAGADAVVIHSKKREADEILLFADLWKNRSPVIIIPTTYPTLTLDEIRLYQIAGIIYANQLLRAALFASRSYLEQLKVAQSISECEQPLMKVQEIFSMQGMDQYTHQDLLYREPLLQPIKTNAPPAK